MNKNYTEIKSFGDACKILGLDSLALTEKWAANGDTNDEIAYRQLKIFIKAINGDWAPRMGDDSQRKYYPWFWVNAAGSGFSASRCDSTATGTNVGSRLCFKTREQAQHAAKYGESMYIDFLL